MTEHFDTIVIGMGPGGEVAASRLLDVGQRVAVIERELIGGECGYWACIPSKTLLRPPPEARAGYEKSGATVMRGAATITGPGTVEVDGRVLSATDIIVATGSTAVLPPVEGLDTVPVWTNRETTTLTEIPAGW